MNGKNGGDAHVSASQAQDRADLWRLPCSLPASLPFRARLDVGCHAVAVGVCSQPLPFPPGRGHPAGPNALWSPLAELGLHLASGARPLLSVHLLKTLYLPRCPCGTGKKQFESREVAALTSHVG